MARRAPPSEVLGVFLEGVRRARISRPQRRADGSQRRVGGEERGVGEGRGEGGGGGRFVGPRAEVCAPRGAEDVVFV